MSLNTTLTTYFSKVKPINDELDFLLMLLPDSLLNNVDQIFDYLRKKYDLHDYVFGSIRFVPASFVANIDTWELFCTGYTETISSLN